MIHLEKLKKVEQRWEKYYEPKKILPKSMRERLTRLGFFDQSDYNSRMQILLDFLDRYSFSTVHKYFNRIKYAGLLGNDEIKYEGLNKHYYMKRKLGTSKQQVRLPKETEFEALKEHIYAKFTTYLDYVMPINKFIRLDDNEMRNYNDIQCILVILLCANTGLRRCEALRLNIGHLRLLIDGETELSLKTKTSNSWNVYYHPNLVTLIADMKNIYREYLKLGTLSDTIKLFTVAISTILTHIKLEFLEANKKPAPCGLGLHMFRYAIASKAAEDNLANAQIILGHTRLKTTEKYVHAHFRRAQHEINRLETYVFKEASELFSKPKNNKDLI